MAAASAKPCPAMSGSAPGRADTLETRPTTSPDIMGSPSPVAAIRASVPFASTPVGWNSRAWRMAAPVWTGRAAISEIFTRPEPGPMSRQTT